MTEFKPVCLKVRSLRHHVIVPAGGEFSGL